MNTMVDVSQVGRDVVVGAIEGMDRVLALGRWSAVVAAPAAAAAEGMNPKAKVSAVVDGAAAEGRNPKAKVSRWAGMLPVDSSVNKSVDASLGNHPAVVYPPSDLKILPRRVRILLKTRQDGQYRKKYY